MTLDAKPIAGAAITALADEASVQPPAAPLLAGGQTLTIRVDMREWQSPVPELLAALPNVTLTFAALPSADYVLSDAVAVERKTATKMQALFARPADH